MGKNKKQINNKENSQEKKQLVDERVDLNDLLDKATEHFGANVNDDKGREKEKNDSNTDEINMNDIFDIATQVMKESNIFESLSKLQNKNNKNNKKINDPSIEELLDMVSEVINDKDQGTNSKV